VFLLHLLVLLVLGNVLLALLFKAVFPFQRGWPLPLFVGWSAVLLLAVMAVTFHERWRLKRHGSQALAARLGGVEVRDSGDALYRRLLNVIDEVALAAGQPVPRVFVLPDEPGINVLMAGWQPAEASLCVTQGALNRLNRGELQGLVAHAFARLALRHGRTDQQVVAMVRGLSWLHDAGRGLMAPDREGHVRPGWWSLGALMAAAGWPGWVTGRLLPMSIFRELDVRCDARATHLTRDIDGLGRVLRKLMHERQSEVDGFRHPGADALAVLWLHLPGAAGWLSGHPPLSERVMRLYGALLPPLPTPALIEMKDAVLEPRMALDDSAFRASGIAGDSEPAVSVPPRVPARLITPPGLSPEATEALGRLRALSGPLQRRLALLAFMVRPGQPAEESFWREQSFGHPWAPGILRDVQALPPAWRVPEYERLLGQLAYESLSSRRDLVISLRNLLKADGRVSAMDRLWWLVARHRMGEVAAGAPLGLIRPITGQGRDLSQLSEDERLHVAIFSAYLARLVPVVVPKGPPEGTGRAWFHGVMRRCGVPADQVPACVPPGADELIHALAGVQELSWSIRPQLLRAWVEEALNHSPGGLMRIEAANALRLVAGLLDSPLPPALASQFPKA
jgi:Zn-dependent protease with chaperone function